MSHARKGRGIRPHRVLPHLEYPVYGASCTQKNGKSPMPVQASRQALIMPPNWQAYSARELWVTTLCSPWNQIAARIEYRVSGWIMPL